ncbi:MAG: prolyl oligopeptidase family serine peptidase [Amylibacter sp.]|nr:prolyl oligopeptidase family serine peptidase [Amylibacter sp.]
MNFLKQIVLTSLALVASATTALACGADTNCQIGDDRYYRIAMPQGHDGKSPVGVIVFSHGYQGSAAGIMRNKALRKVASDLGVALIATKSVGSGWDLPNAPHGNQKDASAELAYYDAVIKDASSKFALDTKRMMATGFSAGGMMAWTLACARSDTYAAFAPMAGTFWLKPPQSCKTPVTNIIYIHGKTDRTVPLTGRVIGNTRQGNVYDTLSMYKKFGNFKEVAETRSGNLTCKNSTNARGKILNFCLFPGRHKFSSKYVKFAWEVFAAKGVF